jgi:hypothetical protein
LIADLLANQLRKSQGLLPIIWAQRWAQVFLCDFVRIWGSYSQLLWISPADLITSALRYFSGLGLLALARGCSNAL